MRSGRFPLSPVVLAVVSLILAATPSALAGGTYKVLYSFKGGSDGALPTGALVFDAEGSLYGVTAQGGGGPCQGFNGGSGCGTVFKLTRQPDGTWKESVLYVFQSTGDRRDGSFPNGDLIFDPAGNLYGTTASGGNQAYYCAYYSQDYGCGTVFQLKPQPSGQWSETVLYRFPIGGDGGFGPLAGLTFDPAGNLLGTVTAGGNPGGEWLGAGVVFGLAPGPSGWTESVLYHFCPVQGCRDGAIPMAGLIWDAEGNLYGTASIGGKQGFPCHRVGCGTVFKLTSNGDGTWTETVLHEFTGIDGSNPTAKLTFDQQGNLYGTTWQEGAFGFGTVFRLKPRPDGTWKSKVLYNFHTGGFHSFFGPWPTRLTFSPEGYLFGTIMGGGTGCSVRGGRGCGVLYKLTPGGRFGRWTYTPVHNFNHGPGTLPSGDVIFDSKGNLYGTALRGGERGAGVVYKVTP